MKDPSDSQLIESVLDEATNRARRGETVSIDEYCRNYPQLADELRVMLPAVAMLERPVAELASQVQPVQMPSVLGDFQIVRQIGRGAMGVVYEATQKTLGRQVALKVFTSGNKSGLSHPERFRREAHIAARLHHTNIIPVFEAGEVDGLSFYAMQLIDGIDLQQWMTGNRKVYGVDVQSAPIEPGKPADASAETGKLLGSTDRIKAEPVGNSLPLATDVELPSPKSCATIALQVAEGLEFAHEQGILHRDIKPSNIMLDKDGRAWIADFGLARQEEAENLTASGDIVGTLRYLPPERFKGQVDVRGDVYSLGLTLFEMLEGQPAYLENDRAQLMHRILSDQAPRLSRRAKLVGRDLQRIVEKSIAHDPAQRYQRAGEMAEDLQRYLDERPILARRPSPLEQLWRWTRKNPTIAGLATTIVVLLVAGLLTVSTLLLQTQKQSRIADENFHTAFETVKTYLTTVSQSPELQASGSEQLRRDLLTAAKSYFEGFADQYRNNSGLRDEVADAYLQLGLIHLELGQVEAAIGVLETSHQLFGENTVGVPNNRANSETLMQLLINLADANDRIGNWQKAEGHYVEALRIAERLVSENPAEVEPILAVARINCLLGKVLSSTDRTDDESACYDRANELFESAKIFQDGPIGIEAVRSANQIQRYLGVDRRKQGQLDEARTHFQNVVKLCEILVAEEPDSSMNQAQLASGYSSLGELGIGQGDLAAARKSLAQAAELFGRLVEQHPSVVFNRDGLATCRMNLGKIEFDSGNYSAANVAWREADRMYARLIEDHPETLDHSFTRAKILANLAAAANQMRRMNDTEEFLRQSIDEMELLVEKFPDNPEFVGMHASLSGNLASILQVTHKDENSQEILANSIKVQAALIAKRPNEPILQFQLAGSLANAGLAFEGSQNFPEAFKHYDRAAKIMEKLVDTDDVSTENIERFLQDCDQVGSLHYRLGHTEEAASLFRKSIQKRESLLTKNPNNSAFLGGQGNAHWNLAMTLRDSGRLDEALLQFDLAIKRLTENNELREPDGAIAKGNLFLEQGKAYCRLGRFAEAIQCCQRAREETGGADENCAVAMTAHIHAATGDWEQAIDEATKMANVYFEDPRDAIELAAAWAQIGDEIEKSDSPPGESDSDPQISAEACFLRSIARIEQAYSQGLRNAPLLDWMPTLDPIRERKDYQELIAKIRGSEN